MTTVIIECSICTKKREVKGRDETEFSRDFGSAVVEGWIPNPEKPGKLLCPDCRDPFKK